MKKNKIPLDICQTKLYIILMPDKKRGDLMSDKRIGRPTDNPRPNKISIRINDEDKNILENYCEKENVNKTEAISIGIKSLKPKK